jgi:spermidine/putrescine transport system permease protein
MLVTFVLPEIVIGLSIRLVIQHLFTFVQLGTLAQLLGLITFQISYPVIIVRARMLVIPKEFEEGGMDLGASPQQAVRRVLLPMLYPAILASFAVVFADTVDDFVTASYLSGPASSQALSQFIYVTARQAATPATNAAATVMLITTTAAIALGYLAYKRVARGQEGADVTSFSQL